MIILEIFQYAKCDMKCIPKVTDWNLTTKKAEKKEVENRERENRERVEEREKKIEKKRRKGIVR